MRTRTAYQCVFACALSALWCLVVCLYSVGVDRASRRLAVRLSSIEERFDGFESRIRSVEKRSSSVSASAGVSDVRSGPVVVGTGTTHSPWSDYRYIDYRDSPTGAVRRHYIRLGPRRASASVDP